MHDLFSFHSRTGLYDGFPPAAGRRGHVAPQLPRAALCMGGGGGGGTAASCDAKFHTLRYVTVPIHYGSPYSGDDLMNYKNFDCYRNVLSGWVRQAIGK